jgi:hypothetical protein
MDVFSFVDIANNTPLKGFLKGSLAFMQHFELVNCWFSFLMSRRG